MATRSRSPRSDAPLPPVPTSGGVSRARALARLLDDAVRIPGTKIGIGLDPLIGLVPGIGDIIGGAMSGYILLVAAQEGVPRSVLLRMLGNLALDSVVGTVPLVGDLFDVGVKANRRNVNLLERYLDAPAETRTSSRATVALVLLTLALLIAGVVTVGVLTAEFIIGLLR